MQATIFQDHGAQSSQSRGSCDALVGRRVGGKFVIERLLGGGAMGLVYRARDESLERAVALKVMRPTAAASPRLVARFRKEALAASRINHPSSTRVIEFGEEPDGLLYIAMEYLEGRDLHTVIVEDWPLSSERIADVMMKGLGALAAGHEMGVIHRDLKPENIMVLARKDDDDRDMVKVCDFGIAQITEDDDGALRAGPVDVAKLTIPGTVMGTPDYMSPEQVCGEPLDARSDLYSMGIVLYQLLTGRTPFSTDGAVTIAFKHVSEPPPPPRTICPGVHARLESVCMKAIAKAKGARFQSAREMRAAIKAALEDHPIAERPLEDARNNVRLTPSRERRHSSFELVDSGARTLAAHA